MTNAFYLDGIYKMYKIFNMYPASSCYPVERIKEYVRRDLQD